MIICDEIILIWFFILIWRRYKRGENLTVELKRPELSEAKWLDKDGNSADKGLVGEPLKLQVSCNADTEEGAGVIFKVYPDGAEPGQDQPTAELVSTNEGGKAEAEWTYRYKHDPDNPLKEKTKYFFTVNGQRCKEVKSGNVEMGMDIDIEILDEFGNTVSDETGYELTPGTGEAITGKASERIEERDLKPDKWVLTLTTKEKES
jgi:hypothetical protein